MSQTIYHIYAGDQCIYHSLKEEEFETTWIALNRLASLLSYSAELSYEKLQNINEIASNSSH
jgi:hypothetical protein